MSVKRDHEFKHEAIQPKARHSIHKTILNWFSTQKPGNLLDAPAGFGHLGLKLKEMGYTVTSGEINPEIFEVKELDCIYTDLNREIRAPDNSFDYTCCVDGLEHMTDPFQAVKEFSRVLKPGGYGVFSIPNYSNIEKRLKFLLHGHLTKPPHIDAYLEQNCQLFEFHNTPLTITHLDFIFKINNLEVCEIKRNAHKRRQYLLYPLVAIFKLISALSSEKSRKKHRPDLTLDERVIMGGNTLIFITRKLTHPIVFAK